MCCSRGDCTRTSSSSEIYCCQRCDSWSTSISNIDSVVCAKSPISSRAPTLDGVVIQNRTGVGIPSCKCQSGATSAKVDNWSARDTCSHAVAYGIQRILAELSIIIRTPTDHGPVVQKCTRVVRTGNDVSSTPSWRQLNSWKIGTHFVRRISSARRVAISKLTRVIPTPAFDGVIVQERAVVICPNGDLLNCSASSEVNCIEGISHLSCRIPSRVGCTKTELPVRVISPTFHRSVIEQDARVCRTRGDGSGRPPRPETNRRRTCNRAECGVADVGRRTRIQSSFTSQTEAPHAVVVEDDARVRITCRHESHSCRGWGRCPSRDVCTCSRHA